MRLTLRTLLSYRDGVLAPKAHEELGRKLRQSQTALDLSDRIDQALSNPKPLANELAEIEQTSSPNEVAEFLDGMMSLDRVFSMERKCIANSAMLAELASVHSILARELLGTSKNPSSQPSQAFLAKLHALHDSKDFIGNQQASSITNTNPYPPAKQTPGNQRTGIDLESSLLDSDPFIGDVDKVQRSRLIFQTILLIGVLAVLVWWILQETSVLPSAQIPALDSSNAASNQP
jgi:hypothetical protein